MKKYVFLVIALCLTINIQAQKALNKRVNVTQLLPADTLLRHQLETEGVVFSSDNSVKLLKTGQEKFDDLFREISNARQSIHMEYFNFRNDSIANLMFSLLEEKRREGVEVRLMFDSFGNSSNNQPLKKHHLDSLRAHGIEIYEFDPLRRFPWINHVFARDHRKIVVIDGRIAYTGGMNVADYYIKGTQKVGSWHDMHCRIEGSEVNTLQRIFLETWYKVTGKLIVDQKYYRGTTSGNKTVGIINRVPHQSPKIIRQFYLDAINDAQHHIQLITPYFTLSRKYKKALKDAVKRGVEVEIMLSTKSDVPLTPDCGFYNAHKLMKAGCKVWMYTPGFHHTKIIMVDDKICTVGSANLDSRSFRWDYEDNAVILNEATTQELTQLFDSEKSDSFLLTEEKWKQWRTPWQRFRGWFAHLLSPFL